LRLYKRQDQQHPSGDREKFAKAAKGFDILLSERFLDSQLWDREPSSWCYGPLKTTKGDPDSWPELRNPTPINPSEKVEAILGHIRNALAHGNIFTRGGSQIECLVLLSKPHLHRPDFNYLLVSPEDFKEFLMKWLQFLSTLPIPTDIVTEIEAEAA
jgi:hypothetical protein